MPSAANIAASSFNVPPLHRAGIKDISVVRSVMAEDLRDLLALRGSVTEDDLRLKGWTFDQVAAHCAKARELADKRSNSRS